MDLTDVSAILTVVTVVVFAGIVLWAYSSKRKQRFDVAAQSVLEDEGTPASAPSQQGRKA